MEEIAGFWKEESLINSSSLQCPACRCNTQAFLDSWAFPGVAEILISGVASDCPGGITSWGQDGGILRLQRRGHYSQAKPRWPCPTLSQSPKPAGPDPIYWQKVQCQELPLPGSGCCPDGSLGSPVLLLIPQALQIYKLIFGLFLVFQLGKNLPARWETGFDSWVGKIPWRRERIPTPVFWPGEFQGEYSP